jgi:hypothetical protein
VLQRKSAGQQEAQILSTHQHPLETEKGRGNAAQAFGQGLAEELDKALHVRRAERDVRRHDRVGRAQHRGEDAVRVSIEPALRQPANMRP